MSAAILIGLALIFAGHKAMGKGLVLGAFFSVLNFVIMGQTIADRLGKSKGRTLYAALRSILFRYLILAVPLVIAIKMPQINLIGVVLGLFAIQLSILGESLRVLFLSTRHQKIADHMNHGRPR